jgi:hypothetical protein
MFGGAGSFAVLLKRSFPTAVGVVALAQQHRNTLAAQERQGFTAV